MTKRQKQIRAFLLSAALVMTQLSQPNLISHADQSIPEDGSIASFGTLESHVARQTVPPGTDQRELDLPRQLKARIYSVDVDSDRDQDGDSSWTEDSSIATGSEARRQNRKNSSVSVTSYWDQIPVIWDSDPVYDSDIEDVYVFTPQAEGYTLSRDAVLPSITVIVSGEASKSPPLSTRKKHSSCSLTNGCLLEEGHEGDCITEKHPNNSIPNNKTIASWTFLDDDFLNMGGLPLTGAGPDNPVDLNAIRSMLPTQLLAEIDGAGQPAAVAIEDWVCPEFIQDPEDNWPVSGSFLFEAVLEKGYLCEPLPSVKVILGGGNTLNGAGTGDFSVAGGISGTDYSYDDVGRILTILTGRELTISNLTPDTPTRDTIVVDVNSGVTANITLAGVNISVHNDSNACAFDMTGAAVNLTLQKDNILESGIYRAGLEAPEGSRLTITGSGSLEAVSRNEGAGIGGGFSSAGTGGSGGNITINGGSVSAKSNYGAGIGGGFSSAGTGGSGGNITINGGSVSAESKDGAGIGGGFSSAGTGGSGGNITINGGSVFAESNDGAGIGGSYGGSGGNIIISSGTIRASSINGAGIGGGSGGVGDPQSLAGSGGDIQITGDAVVRATGGRQAAGIGGGSGSIKGGSDASAHDLIGSGGSGGSISISGNAIVFAEGVSDASYIGGGNGIDGVADSACSFSGGVIFEGIRGQVYGSTTLPRDLTVLTGYTLTLAEGAVLTIPRGITMTNEGGIINNGIIYIRGTLTGRGPITGTGSIIHDSGGGNNSGGGGGRSVSSTVLPLRGVWELTESGIWMFKTNSGSYVKNQWGLIDNLWYYFNTEGHMLTGWQFISDIWYYLNTKDYAASAGLAEGAMSTGWYFDPFYKRWFYLDADGAMVTGRRQIEGVWYYFNPESDGTRGAMIEEPEAS